MLPLIPTLHTRFTVCHNQRQRVFYHFLIAIDHKYLIIHEGLILNFDFVLNWLRVVIA